MTQKIYVTTYSKLRLVFRSTQRASTIFLHKPIPFVHTSYVFRQCHQIFRKISLTCLRQYVSSSGHCSPWVPAFKNVCGCPSYTYLFVSTLALYGLKRVNSSSDDQFYWFFRAAEKCWKTSEKNLSDEWEVCEFQKRKSVAYVTGKKRARSNKSLSFSPASWTST